MCVAASFAAAPADLDRWDAFEFTLEILRMQQTYPDLDPAQYAARDEQFRAFLYCGEADAPNGRYGMAAYGRKWRAAWQERYGAASAAVGESLGIPTDADDEEGWKALYDRGGLEALKQTYGDGAVAAAVRQVADDEPRRREGREGGSKGRGSERAHGEEDEEDGGGRGRRRLNSSSSSGSHSSGSSSSSGGHSNGSSSSSGEGRPLWTRWGSLLRAALLGRGGGATGDEEAFRGAGGAGGGGAGRRRRGMSTSVRRLTAAGGGGESEGGGGGQQHSLPLCSISVWDAEEDRCAGGAPGGAACAWHPAREADLGGCPRAWP